MFSVNNFNNKLINSKERASKVLQDSTNMNKHYNTWSFHIHKCRQLRNYEGTVAYFDVKQKDWVIFQKV